MTISRPGLKIKAILFFWAFIPGFIFSQAQRGTVLSSATNSGIGYVNVRIHGKDIGTVSDDSGSFEIKLDNVSDDDSLHFSMIGYECKFVQVGTFRSDSVKDIFLTPISYDLREVTIVSYKHRNREIELGDPVTSDVLRSGFAYNDLGSELGIRVDVRGRVKLINLNLNVAVCTFDSVTYRLNIYNSEGHEEYKNILTEPIYISFSKDQISDVITIDLSKYSIVIGGEVYIALELYKELGEGKLFFRTQYFTGFTYHRKTIDGEWSEAAGAIGMYLNGKIL